jgi:hypothetical protein
VQPGLWYIAYMIPALVETYIFPKLLNFGFVLPELGIKYVWRRHWNLGFDFFSLPIGFGRDDNNVSIVAILNF